MMLNDKSLMPFGKYRGTQMEKLPASYLHWLWNESIHKQPEHPLHQYISSNMAALQKEHPDGIWKKAPAPQTRNDT